MLTERPMKSVTLRALLEQSVEYKLLYKWVEIEGIARM